MVKDPAAADSQMYCSSSCVMRGRIEHASDIARDDHAR
jgi:hypothetical protein